MGKGYSGRDVVKGADGWILISNGLPGPSHNFLRKGIECYRKNSALRWSVSRWSGSPLSYWFTIGPISMFSNPNFVRVSTSYRMSFLWEKNVYTAVRIQATAQNYIGVLGWSFLGLIRKFWSGFTGLTGNKL